MATGGGASVIQPGIFEDLQQKIDEDSAVKDALRDIVQNLEKQDRATQSILSRAHSTTTNDILSVVTAAQNNIVSEVQTIQQLSAIASQHPYYRFNYAWSRQMESVCFTILLCGWLGGFGKNETGKLLTIEEVGQVLNVPVNLKDRDAFHLTIEEYLLSLITLLDELARLARNSVTLGDYRRPLQISQFIKDVHAGFQILNLKNDSLRKRSDGIKYRVKEVEDVVYDLSLRGLLPKD
ncbi:Translin-1 [Fulvia fulva]|uniref:Translin-1 n=1 Tax=Passalora fulva TaxID=5499 RepID=A0A9Q8P4A1_PASFU|nr:Translin-1 [Fulvia fulva]KAK4635513.1 Translin-1 [Fulvia fulva]KAK4638544.1 Translin-1 [Fulvia fulva]UJO12601.1 Translin-1 [Fulvia fulva]WPV08658.1 Translin-1 [Fulvia fulva]WPV23479.1 Translin-1 [Fulvia fulva]